MEKSETKSSSADWSQLGLHEYLLVAYPDNAVNEKVMEEKKNFYNEYKQKIAGKTKPHITIANFLAREAMEETAFRYLERVLKQQQSFEITLNNYSGFPPHDIFLRIQNKQPFKQIASQLKVVSNYVDSCSCPPLRFIPPHLSIARNLPETLYLKAMMDYSQKIFHETFMVNELVLLRRTHQYDSCKPVQVFRLQPRGFKQFSNTSFN